MKFVLALALSFGAFADRGMFLTYLDHARVAQDHAERAYVRSGVVTDATLVEILSAVDGSTGLLRRIAAEPRLTEDERGRLYEEVLRGQDGKRERGSLARLVWSTITHHGADDVNGFTGDVDAYRTFRQFFREAFLDVKSLVTFRADHEGLRHWAAAERHRRERAARAVIVRLADVLHGFDQLETRSKKAHAYGYKMMAAIADPVTRLRRERVTAEGLAGIFYGTMVALNVFLAPMVLPLVQVNYVGWLTGFAWGSTLVTGGVNAGLYAAAGVNNWLGRTRRTYEMLLDLERLARGPGSSTKEALDHAMFGRRLREGHGALGRHRAAMMARGYRPDDAAAMDCEDRLRSAVR